ncbi:thioredoxin-domain-containing protein [Mycena albidolilacea]|uniref:Thioredoxin-domain-containing protein n=1 Tax=Mycena albidolilacea TaxID=1033008 RepID=A0AAD7EVC5_9AGAR|nr:thioredoxin-domain-containing protein [Mycena albidolilacea]
MAQKNSPIEIQNVKQWNETLRSATAAGMTVLVDFHATWCAPCKAIAPRFSQLAAQNPHIRFLRVDTDAQKAIAAKYQVTAMPTFYAIRAGKPVDMIRGADPQGLARLVQQHGGPNPPVPPLPEGAEAAKVAGNAFYKDGYYPEAIEQYTAALALAPASGALYGNRSIAYLKAEPPQPDLALADAQKATEVEPKWGKGYARLGEALQALERDEEAAKAFETAVELSQGLGKTEAKQKLEAVKKRLGWH